MNVALDIDGTISERPEFFSLLSRSMRAAGHRVVVITFRDPRRTSSTRAELQEYGVEYDELVLAPSLGAKGELCRTYDVDLFFDDQDECLVDVPEDVLVLKVRNGGNFDFESRKWLSTRRLTEFV